MSHWVRLFGNHKAAHDMGLGAERLTELPCEDLDAWTKQCAPLDAVLRWRNFTA